MNAYIQAEKNVYYIQPEWNFYIWRSDNLIQFY